MRTDLDRELDRLEPKLPPRVARLIRWVRRPSARWVRWPLGLLLIVGGVLAVLPVFGLWMIPLGLASMVISGLSGPPQ